MLGFALTPMLDEEACYSYLVAVLPSNGLHCPLGHPLLMLAKCTFGANLKYKVACHSPGYFEPDSLLLEPVGKSSPYRKPVQADT